MATQTPNPAILPGERLLAIDMGALAGLQPDELVSHFDAKAKAIGALSGLSGSCRTVDIVGVLQQSAESPSADYLAIAGSVRKAAADPVIETVVLRIDTPGGSAMGILECAAAIQEAAAIKPVIAWIATTCCSGGFWLASQATKIYASDPMSHVGSIGTYMVLEDSSKFFAAFGIERHLVSTGGAKGQGVPGVPIGDALKANAQTLVDDIQSHFNIAISNGRRLSIQKVQELADGTVMSAQTAQTKGLIDGVVGSWPKFTSQIEKGFSMMKTASISELREACPSADDGFILSMLEAGASVEVARSSWGVIEKDRANTRELPKVGNPAAPTPNVKNNTPGHVSADGAEFMELVDQRIADAECSRPEAVAYCRRRFPDVYEEFTNAQ